MFNFFKVLSGIYRPYIDFFNKAMDFLWRYYYLNSEIIIVDGIEYKNSIENPDEYISKKGDVFSILEEGMKIFLLYKNSEGLSAKIEHEITDEDKIKISLTLKNIGSKEDKGIGLFLSMSKDAEFEDARNLLYEIKQEDETIASYFAFQCVNAKDYFNIYEKIFKTTSSLSIESFKFNIYNDFVFIDFYYDVDKDKTHIPRSVVFKDIFNTVEAQIKNGNLVFSSSDDEDIAGSIFAKVILYQKSIDFNGFSNLLCNLFFIFKTPKQHRDKIFCFFDHCNNNFTSKDDFVAYMQDKIGEKPFIITILSTPDLTHCVVVLLFKNGKMMFFDSSNIIGSMTTGVLEKEFPIFKDEVIVSGDLQGMGTCAYFSAIAGSIMASSKLEFFENLFILSSEYKRHFGELMDKNERLFEIDQDFVCKFLNRNEVLKFNSEFKDDGIDFYLKSAEISINELKDKIKNEIAKNEKDCSILNKRFFMLVQKIKSNPFLCEQFLIYPKLFKGILDDKNTFLLIDKNYLNALSKALSKLKRLRTIRTFEEFDSKIPYKFASTELEIKVVNEISNFFTEVFSNSISARILLPIKNEKIVLDKEIVKFKKEIFNSILKNKSIEDTMSIIKSSKFLSSYGKDILCHMILSEISDGKEIGDKKKSFILDLTRSRMIEDYSLRTSPF